MANEELFDVVSGNWIWTTLGQACVKGGGDIQTGPFGSQLHASDYVPNGIPSVMPQNIGDNRIVLDGIAHIKSQDAKRLNRYLLRNGDIVYSRRGDVERRALIRIQEEGWLCGTGCLRIRVGHGIADPVFISYYLAHPAVRNWIVQHAIGATMPNLNTSILSSLPILLPPLPEQRAIARILGSLDDKIEANRHMNETLEAMARAIFKSWFVDFDPVRAKAEGQEPAGMDAETAALFPDGFEVSRTGEIPRGWEMRPIGDVVQVLGGGTPSTKEPAYWESGTHSFCTPKDMSSLTSPVLLNTERYLTDKGMEKVSSGQLPIGTVLLSSRAPIGYLAVSEIPVSINQGIIAMVCDKELPNLYVLHWAQANIEGFIAVANGSTFLEISKWNFRPIRVLVPPQRVLREFSQAIEPLYFQIVNNLKQSRFLIELRDAILPRLISGEIRVNGSDA